MNAITSTEYPLLSLQLTKRRRFLFFVFGIIVFIIAYSIGAILVKINTSQTDFIKTFVSATLRQDIKKYNKVDGLKKELSTLYLQKHMLNEACSRQGQSLVNLAKLKSYGLTEDRILQLNNLLFEDDGIKEYF